MMDQYLPFEKPIVELETKLKELESLSLENNIELKNEVPLLQAKITALRESIFGNLTTWQRVQLSRHPLRPHASDYIELIFKDFMEMHGDRTFREDPAIIGGPTKLNQQTVMVIGLQKGRSTKEKVFRNFGMPHPEGYRKAIRFMDFAERFDLPLITFIDTPGAYPGLGAEERGQSEAIASCIEKMASLNVPSIAYVIGEGGSGGALSLGVADRIFMLEYSIYSVISPEGCAAILWNDSLLASKAAEAMKVTADEVAKLGFIDDILKEPLGGAHRDVKTMAHIMKESMVKHLNEIKKLDNFKSLRIEKYKKIGVPL
ncbi:MAG: acetyl-CoA carboxylase carboxyltransferase subunit alpha [Deltaproteobacteria bacterium]|nr:acetyl-CoA carboxylase carboxyltransferase subunit alpha [Deltaproteobacteria bacterium]